MTMRPALPIVSQATVDLDDTTRLRLVRLAQKRLREEPALCRTDMFGSQVATGLCDAPALLLEDHGEIALFANATGSPLEYRSFLLGDAPDVFVVGGNRYPGFETYCLASLGLGAGTVVQPAATADAPLAPLSVRCLRDGGLLARLSKAARQHGGFNLMPYLGTGNVWRLAAAIADAAGTEVRVAAPPPRLTRRVNDKLWFLERVREVLATDASPLSFSVFGPAALASRLRALARRHPRVVVKVPDSSGSLGNVMIRSEYVADRPLADVRERLIALLQERGWRQTYPLMVGVWDHPVVASPSVNMWIPRPEEGLPVIEGLFEQMLTGDEASFVGAEPSVLPPDVEQRLAWEAMCLAQYLQHLGYYGRCGFDAILTGDMPASAQLRWVECNARWGGVSIPVTIANRLLGDYRRRSIIIVQQTNLAMPPRPLEAILELLSDHLFPDAKDGGGVVLLAPSRLVSGTGMSVMAIADSAPAARRLLNEVRRRLA